MDGGQKIDINLESPLDTKSSDMLVSVNDVRFAHNRQKYQGHVLPTSLRYERNGWAAGWYVYDFKMGGGYIFSHGSSGSIEAPYLAATRAKLNNTPTYVISFKVAKNNDLTDADAVASAVQFQAWYTMSPSINARECKEALITDDIQPGLSFNYAVEGVDYKRKLRFNFDVCSSEDPTFEALTDEYGSANLDAVYEGRDADGTVTATLYNREVNWEWETDLYIPKDLIDEDGYKYGKFEDVTNNIINWKLGSEHLQFDDAQNKFIYNDVDCNPDTDLGIDYALPLTYTVPLHKYYSELKNITWAVQGRRTLFNSADEDSPFNQYRVSTEHLHVNSSAVYNNSLFEEGIDGPDIETVSMLRIPLNDIPSNINTFTFNENTDLASEFLHGDDNDTTPNIIPLMNVEASGINIPGKGTRNVVAQIYFKYQGYYEYNYVGNNSSENRNLAVIPMSYAHAAIGGTNEVVYIPNSEVEYATYNIDGAVLNNNQNGLRIGNKLIVGRLTDIDFTITALNGVSFNSGQNLHVSGKCVSTNFIFAKYEERNETAVWRTGSFSTDPTFARCKPYTSGESRWYNYLAFRIHDCNQTLYNVHPNPSDIEVSDRYCDYFYGPSDNGYNFAHYIADLNPGESSFNGDSVGLRGEGSNVVTEITRNANGSVTFTTVEQIGGYFEFQVGHGGGAIGYASIKLYVSNQNAAPKYIIPIFVRKVNADVLPFEDGGTAVWVQHNENKVLCAVHNAPTITSDTNGVLTPAYGWAIIKPSAIFGKEENVTFGTNYYTHTTDSEGNDVATEVIGSGHCVKQAYVKEGEDCRIFTASSFQYNIENATGVPGINLHTLLYSWGNSLIFWNDFSLGGAGTSVMPYNPPANSGYPSSYEVLQIYVDNQYRVAFFDLDTGLAGSDLWLISPYGRFGHGRYLPYYWTNMPGPATWNIVIQTNELYLALPSQIYKHDMRMDPHWIPYDNTDVRIAGTGVLTNFCMDIVDADTGEVLIEHNNDSITLDANSYISINLRQDKMLRGRVFYNKVIEYTSDWKTRLPAIPRAQLYSDSMLSGAFFPVCTYRFNDQQSVYDANSIGGCQGIIIYNVIGVDNSLSAKYMTMMLSPLSSYIIPPKLDDEFLSVYAGKAYTHHIKWSGNGIDILNGLKLLDDSSTNATMVEVTRRNDVLSNSRIEVNNKYYTDKPLLLPASISYYNGQVHINYKARSGSTIEIEGSTYDLGTADMSIQQTADLVSLYLPEHLDEKYHFVLGAHDDILNVKETKDIINTIADINKHWVDIQLSGIDFSADSPVVTLQFIERHENIDEPTVKTISYADVLNIDHPDVLEYSDENQIVVSSHILGTTVIHLPPMPEHKFIYDIADNKVDVSEVVEGVVNSNNRFVYDYAANTVSNMYIKNKELAKASIQLKATDNSAVAYNVYTVAINESINTTVYFKHFGIYKIVGVTAGGFTPTVTQLTFDRHATSGREFTFTVSDISVVSGMNTIATSGTYVFNFDDFDDKELCTPKYLVYSATDVRNPDPETQTKEFARVLADNEYQLIKQHWDSTVATECFWWIDSEHTLELTKDRFILKVKDSSDHYDDWQGDTWKVVHEFKRTEYLTSEADTFIVSSATGRNARGYLYILQPVSMNTINVTIYDPLVTTQDGQMTAIVSSDIEFKHVALGTVLNAETGYASDKAVLCTYSDIVATSLLADSKLTAVCIKGVHWLGIQYDKNFNQWCVALGSTREVIHGYGCIGINGYATGGMLPAKYFDGHGFNDTVYDINKLEAEEGKTLESLDEFNIFNERIVGDENQQWYISEELEDIVMAVDVSKHRAIKLPITSKYAQIYSSPSYAKYTVHAFGIQIKQLMDLFTDEKNPIWMDIIKYAMFPIVWYLSPYTNVINYLQQTIGQYAYTHYNSTSISRKSSKLHDEVTADNAGLSEDAEGSHVDALITDDLSFDVVHIPQEQSFKDNSWDNILGIFASMVVSATDMAMKDISVNSLQNQSAVNDIGKKFSQAFLQNIGSMSVTGFTMQSTKPMLKSEVTAVKTLDMFYSTSAEQNCFAGPGFVNMQFVAQCTAQSVTSVQLEAQQTQMFMLLRELTTWQGKVVIFLLDTLKDWMFKMSDNMGGGPSAGVVVGLGWIGAVVMSSLGYALVAAKALVKLGIEAVDSMLDSFFPSGVKTTVTAQLSRHNYDIEGKHAYGNKSEQFFWPCADCNSKLYTDESVEAVLQKKPWPLEMPTATAGNNQTKIIYQDQPSCITATPGIMSSTVWEGEVPYNIAMCKGRQKHRALPDSTAYVIGTESFMPTAPFKNENIGEGEPVFTPPAVQDYIIDKNWNIFVTAMSGDALWVSCKDTKLFDGNYSNIVVTDDFCGIAAPHVAIEVKRNICEEYLRPWAVSPDAIALNITGLNCAYDEVAYHAFDGYGYRITDWLGSSGMNKERYTWQYCFQINDRFKRSNKLPPNQFMGNFQALPSMSLDVKDKIFNEATVVTEEKGLRTGVAGENKDTQRYALPIFTEQISSLPAIVRALSPYKLAVIDGITSLTTDVRVSQSVYKIPDSVDFNINDKLYRMTNEYICSVKHEKGLEVVEYLVPALGLTYLGATPFMAYFYNQATRQYYIYQGGNTLQVMEMLERFRDIKGGIYDFINQEVVMPCLATLDRLDRFVHDDADETDNIVIPIFRRNKVGGELTPPLDTIFNTRSWFRTISTPAGLVFQGPNRCIINRFVWSQYMLSDIKANKGKWVKVPREEYHPYRTYAEKYQDVLLRLDSKLKGWTHNPFLLVTSPIGINEETDCKFEWEITFAWTVEMEQLFEQDEYVVVNVMAETMCPGGKKFARPTHIFLTRELFTRTGNVGYYSFRYQSESGAGNRERLHIWSDGYIAISSLQLEYKPITEKRNEILTTQEDIKGMKEM